MRKVESSEEDFSNGDILDCDLHTVQTTKPDGGILTTYEISKVHDHIKTKKQNNLPFKGSK